MTHRSVPLRLVEVPDVGDSLAAAAQAADAAPPQDSPADLLFDRVLDEIRHLHRTGHQRAAMAAITAAAATMAESAPPSLDRVLQLIVLRKAVLLALRA
jgi:hypothetical protein